MTRKFEIMTMSKVTDRIRRPHHHSSSTASHPHSRNSSMMEGREGRSTQERFSSGQGRGVGSSSRVNDPDDYSPSEVVLSRVRQRHHHHRGGRVVLPRSRMMSSSFLDDQPSLVRTSFTPPPGPLVLDVLGQRGASHEQNEVDSSPRDDHPSSPSTVFGNPPSFCLNSRSGQDDQKRAVCDRYHGPSSLECIAIIERALMIVDSASRLIVEEEDDSSWIVSGDALLEDDDDDGCWME